MTDKEILALCKEWFDDIAEMCDRLTSGNVSHNGKIIHGLALSCSEFIDSYLNKKQ